MNERSGSCKVSGEHEMKKKSIGIGLLGLGVIAGQVARVLTEKADELAEKVGCPLVLRRIKVLPQDLARPQAKKMPARLFTTDDDEFFSEPGIDIVVEAIGGERPAFDYLKRAIRGGKHAVTSNKELIAKRGMELLALAQKKGVGLQYEASVGGGIPLIAPFKHDLVANSTNAIYVIINRISKGKSPVWGDRSHFHHKLLDIGWSKRKIAIFYWLITLILGIIALQLNAKQKLFTMVLLSLTFGGFLLWLNYFIQSSKQPDPDNG